MSSEKKPLESSLSAVEMMDEGLRQLQGQFKNGTPQEKDHLERITQQNQLLQDAVKNSSERDSNSQLTTPPAESKSLTR